MSRPEEEKSETRKLKRQQVTTTFENPALGYRFHDKPQQGPSSRNQPNDRQNSPATQWYDRERDTLKRMLEYVTSLADDPTTVSITRDETTLNMTITFIHHIYKWSIEFPSDFPRGTAKLKNQYNSCSVSVLANIDSFEEALESTLQEQCAMCKHRVSSKSSGRRETPDGHQRRETPVSQWYETQQNTLTRTVDFMASLADGKRTPKISRDKSTKNITMEFKHHDHEWAVEFPPNFPKGDVKLKTKVKGTTVPRAYAYSTSYSYTNASPLSYNVKACGNVNRFMEKLESALREYCEKCKNHRRYALNNRYGSNLYK